MILMEHCSSALHLQKSCSNHGQTHRGSAIVGTPCRSPAEFAIRLPNNSILVVDPKCSKAYIIQLKACIKSDLRTWQPRHWVHASRVFRAWSVRTGLFMRSDGCGILLTNVGNSLITCSSRWTPHKMIRMEHCSSALHLQKSCSNHGQTHRGNANVVKGALQNSFLSVLQEGATS